MAGDLHRTRQRTLQVIGQILGVPESALGDDSSPESVAGWDSLAHMKLVLALEEEFRVRFTDDQVMTLTRVDVIVSRINERI